MKSIRKLFTPLLFTSTDRRKATKYTSSPSHGFYGLSSLGIEKSGGGGGN